MTAPDPAAPRATAALAEPMAQVAAGRSTTRLQAFTQSLRWRLLAATVVGLVVAMGLAGLALERLFHEHVREQFGAALTAQLDQVTARLEFDGQARPLLDPQGLSDPRWGRPLSGLYWQVDGPAADARGVLRSRSLWDAVLQAPVDPPADQPADGRVHLHTVAGPDGARLMLAERTVTPGGQAQAWRLLVAADLAPLDAAVARFNGVLRASLAVLLLLLCLAALAQVLVGLAPLRALQRSVGRLRHGQDRRLQGRFPAELQPLVEGFNAVLDRNDEVVERARTQAGNLAHALKTPLAAMGQAASAARRGPAAEAARAGLPDLVDEQVALARRHVDWHLARARAAAAQALPGAHVPLAPVVDALLRVMARVHAERDLALDASGVPTDLAFAGEVQDLQEILGNLIDNAAQWARHRVDVTAWRAGPDGRPAEGRPPGTHLAVRICDDGPGIDASRREAVLQRGARLDESRPGSGLGLAIVAELVALYGGSLQLGSAPSGGLCATVQLPAAVGQRVEA